MTDENPDLFTYARASDPETSLEAALSVDMKGLEARVLRCLKEHGPATSEEVSNRLGIALGSITPRFKRLFERGLAVRTEGRRPGASGKNRVVWAAV